jgi:hypothetical protein
MMRQRRPTSGLSGFTRRTLLCLSMLLAPLGRSSEHPGNVFLQGEDVRVTVPAAWAGWSAIDVDGKEVAHGPAASGRADLGALPIGYFEVRQQSGTGKITAAVLAKVTAAEETPIALDAAMSWFYPEPEQIRDVCALCRMAGVNWVRDRSSWPEIEPARGQWAADGRYERAMRIEHEAGLKVLQVNHIAPPWASKDTKRFPEDLRDVYAFYRGLAQRWRGLADAIEPWNEPDIIEFGGQTGCEIASFQKAAYLGLKAGNPDFPVNDAVFAIDRAQTLEEFGANDVFPYFDRYDLHHYVRLPDYPRAYGRHRAVSGGRPMWTTEFNLMVNWADEKTKEPSEDDLRVQGFRVGKVFATALNEGTQKAFYFILGDYVERKLQYGLIHHDLTPRPAYVAFAAVGRLLNGATPLGRVDLGDAKLKGYLFKTQVDGAARETLVAWSETKQTEVEIPGVERTFDYLGRELPRDPKVKLTRATVFLVLPPGGSKGLKVEPPPARAPWREGTACPVVLQLIGEGEFKQSAFRFDKTRPLRLVAYNFSDRPARGRLVIDGATGDAGELAIPPGGREERALSVDKPGRVTVRMDLGLAGQAIVAANVAEPPPPR